MHNYIFMYLKIGYFTLNNIRTGCIKNELRNHKNNIKI